ncbi:hypothetical protein [Stenotrophomonas maltophilia]|nr:hypothetical protein [Stenotrophomonas maltophilia]
MINYIRTGSIACGSSTINREMVFESRLTKGARGYCSKSSWWAQRP